MLAEMKLNSEDVFVVKPNSLLKLAKLIDVPITLFVSMLAFDEHLKLTNKCRVVTSKISGEHGNNGDGVPNPDQTQPPSRSHPVLKPLHTFCSQVSCDFLSTKNSHRRPRRDNRICIDLPVIHLGRRLSVLDPGELHHIC